MRVKEQSSSKESMMHFVIAKRQQIAESPAIASALSDFIVP